MDLAINLTSPCRVRVLLVPVSPIKKSTFWEKVELVKKFGVVRLGDVTPDLHKGAGAMFSSQVFQEGQMHFQFVTNYKRDHAHLEDFQPHRRIFGVIGIMDCQEWKDKDLSEGYRSFVETLDKYPTAVATRCYAFDPTETQPDDTKGLIMIPNVGNMSFYISTMICDFASEILTQFATIAGRIESLQVLESPIPLTYTAHRFDPVHHPQPHSPQPQSSLQQRAPLPSISSPNPQGDQSRPNYRASQPLPPPVPTQSASSSFLKRASTSAASRPPPTKLAPMPAPSPNPSTSRSTSAHGPISSDIGKTKRRTPGRIKKLLADFYLLAGRLPDAVSHYQQAIEMTRSMTDFLWLASAMEGLACATLLLEYLHADVGHIVSRGPSAAELLPAEGQPPSPTAEKNVSLLDGPKSTVSDIVEQYTQVLHNYARVSTTASVPIPGLIYAEACAKVARFLLTVHVHGGWNEKVLGLLVQGKLWENGTEIHPGQFSSIINPTQSQRSTIPRFEIAEWAMRIWVVHLEDLSLLDQIHLMTSMATVLSTIGYHRKASWVLYESTTRMLPLLIQSRTAIAGSRDQAKKSVGKSDSGVLDVMKQICQVYGLGERNVHDGGALEAMHSQEEPETNANTVSNNKGVRGAVAKEHFRFGWPALQIDILRQCISIAEALPDYAAMLYYTTVLLKNMYRYISKEEQIRLATSIQRIVAMGKRTGQVESSVNYWGVNIVSSIEALLPIPRKAVYQHPIHSSIVASAVDKSATGDPFIYNPFAQKKNEKFQVTLVQSEMCEFKVMLTNPFGFDLDVQNVVLSTSGVPFNPTPASVIIPANGTLTIRLAGIPEESGVLTIRGCLVKIVGFAEQEFLVDLGQKPKPKDSRDRKKDDQTKEEFVKLKQSGLSALQSGRRRESSNELKPVEFYELTVIDDQPLLKIKSTSLLHSAVMLYEGEMTHISIELENIGNIPVDFITLSFTDSTTINPLLVNPELPMEEQYEIELFTKGTHVFSWEGSMNEAAQIIGKKVVLPPGSQTTIIVNVYGKRGCTGGTIQVEYGYLERAIQKQKEASDQEDATNSPSVFYTRQLYLPVLVTVYQNLEPLNWDVLYLRHNALVSEEMMNKALEDIQSLDINKGSDIEQPVEDLLLVTRQADNDKQAQSDYCLVTLDVRNTWTVPFNIEFMIDNGTDSSEQSLQSVVTIQPGWTKRVVLPVKRLFLQPQICVQPIPSFEPNKQFVVSQAPKMPPEQERARLQMFWYRESLLKRIKATWRCTSTGRHGVLHLRPSLRLTPLQLTILKKEDMEFIVEMEGANVKKAGHRRFSCNCNDFVSMNVSIRNRHMHPVKLILRIQPVQSYNDGAKEYDLSDKLLMQGLQQVVLPEIPGNNNIVTYRLPLCFLSRGQFEFLHHAEDVHTREVYYDHEWAIVDVNDT
ncbi:TRAPP II complex [Phycomyces nitens]|nr:TRAPP II complex [Phycomyces nitens]